MKTLYKLSIFLGLIFHSVSAFAQEKPVYERVQQVRSEGAVFKVLSDAFVEGRANESLLRQFIDPTEVTFLQYNKEVLLSLDTAILLSIPRKESELQLELVEVPTSFYTYQVVASDGSKHSPNRKIKHYRGIVKGSPNSLVAISFLEKEIMGIIATDEGNLNLALDRRSNQHILYNDKNVMDKPRFKCEMIDEGFLGYDPEVILNSYEEKLLSGEKCTRFYYETEFDIFQAKGSVASVEGFIAGLHNQIATLYQHENLETFISEIFVWNTIDPYTGATTATLLSQFQSNTTSINGDLGHLLTFRDIGGGRAAGFNGLCNSNVDNSLAVSMIQNSYLSVPNYSWSVQVVTHEFGHLFGSRHTHACVWNGNNTAIDGCDPNGTEGGCSVPGIPSGGGTIMSYCHLQSVGINFNLGFGTQPGNVIRNSVASSACLCECGFSITGPSPLCDSETYTVSNLPTGATVTGWSASPSGGVTLSGSGNSRTATKSGTFRGEVILTATVSTACGIMNIEKAIWVGTPPKPVFVDGSNNPIFDETICLAQYAVISCRQEPPQLDILEWEWSTTSSNVNISATYGHTAQIVGTSSGTASIRVRTRNACGWSQYAYLIVTVQNCSAFITEMKVFPNPADESLTVSTVEGENVTAKSSVTFDVTLYDATGRSQLTATSRDGKLTLDTGALPEGTYFLHIMHGDDIEKRQIVIKHR